MPSRIAQLPILIFSVSFVAAGIGWGAGDSPAPAPAPTPAPTRLPLERSHLEPQLNHYGAYILGKKIGWMSESLRLAEFEGQSVYAFELLYLEKLLNGEEAMTSQSRDVEYFAAQAPFGFVAATATSEQNGFTATTEIRRSAEGDDQFVATIRSGKSTRTKQLGKFDYTLGDALTPQVWCRSALAVGDTIRVRELDLTDLEVRPGEYRVTGVLAEAAAPAAGQGSEVGRGRYELAYYDQVSKTRASFTVDSTGRMLSGKVAGSLELKLEDADEAKKIEANLDLFAASLIEIEVPLGDAADIRELVLEITGNGAGAIVDGPNEDASFNPEAGRLLLKVGRGHAAKAKVTDEERAKALEETTAYPTKDPQVAALVKRAIGRATRPKARIKRLVDFVDSFVIDDYGNEPLSVNDIIDSRRGDCTEHSQLFVTMARAAGIPAREVSGFIYGEDSRYTFGGHAWCEVEVDGHWHPVDPTWGETVINATHIRVSGERPSSEEMELYMGGLKFRVLSARDRKGVVRRFAEPSK